MQTPDKIYCGNNGHGNLSYSTEKIYPSMEEYIRKDSLLEWAKAELSHADANIEAYPYEDAYRGHREKIEELIEHIESL